jgi:hypothetical protein
MYITALGMIFFYACRVYAGEISGKGGGASHTMPEEEMPFTTAER